MPTRLVLVVVSALLVGGCAGAAASETAPGGDADRRAVQEATIAYLTAYLDGNGEQACGGLTDDYRRRMDARARAEGFAGCADVLGQVGVALFAQLPGADVAAAREEYLRPARVLVELAGDRATAGYAEPEAGRVITRVALVRAPDGAWRIERLGVKSLSTP
jgi:hypothetical protein